MMMMMNDSSSQNVSCSDGGVCFVFFAECALSVVKVSDDFLFVVCDRSRRQHVRPVNEDGKICVVVRVCVVGRRRKGRIVPANRYQSL